MRARVLIGSFAIGALCTLFGACVGDDPVDSVGSVAPDASSSSGSGSLADGSAREDGAVVADGGRDAVVQIAAGLRSSCARYASGSVYCWGDNAYGEIGSIGTPTDHVAPTPVALPLPAVSVSVGAYTACAVLDDQSLWCWGDAEYGALGIPTETANECGARHCAVTPIPLPGVSYKQVAVGYYIGCAIAQDDTVYCWGSNSASQSGQALSTAYVDPPKRVLGVAHAAKLSLGYGGRVACALDTSGVLSCWGNNSDGALGHAPGTAGDVLTDEGRYSNLVPSRIAFPEDAGRVVDFVAAVTVCAVVESGGVYCWGSNAGNELQLDAADAVPHFVPSAIPGIANATAVSGGGAFCALQGTSAPLCWGPEAAVATGSAVRDAGICLSSGGNSAPCLGVAAIPGRALAQMSVGPKHGVGIDADGVVVSWGDDSYGRLGTVATDGSVQINAPAPVLNLP